MILTDNYGEAGAMNTYGPAFGLPTAVSGELTYYYWKPARMDGPVIAVGFDSVSCRPSSTPARQSGRLELIWAA